MEFPERLTQALDRWPGGSHRTFSEYLRGRGVLGASSRQLARYLRGESEPGLGWITAACEALNVSADWLILGEGSIDSARISSTEIPKAVVIAEILDDVVKKRGHFWFDFADQVTLDLFCMRLLVLNANRFGLDRSKLNFSQPMKDLAEGIGKEQLWSLIDELFPALREDSPFAGRDKNDVWARAHSAFYASLSAAWANEMPYMIGKKRRT